MLSTRILFICSVIGLLYSTTECTFNEDPTPPAAPSGISVHSEDTTVQLEWDRNNEDDFEGYNLYKSENPISDISNLEPLNGEELYFEVSYTDQNVENGTTYYYRITSVDLNSNESDPSVEIQVTPFSAPPTRP